MWTYEQSSGKLSKDGILIASCYSGCGEGKNNPSADATPDVGPIPQGQWKIEGPPQDTESHGPYVLHLSPAPDTITFGRSGFLIHGDSVQHPGTASKGCIIADRATRARIWQSGDTNLTVVARNPLIRGDS